MRMWTADVKYLCDQHLLGEHHEMHMFVGAINRGTSVDGYIRGNLLDPSRLVARHTELATEMSARGMNHLSPLPRLYREQSVCPLDEEESRRELFQRCKLCELRYIGGMGV